MGVAERVEASSQILKQRLDLVVAVHQVLVDLLDDLVPLLAVALVPELVLVHLGERFLTLRVLQLEVPTRQELVRVDRDAPLDVVKLVRQNPLLDQVFDRTRRLLGHGRRDFAHPFKLEVLLEKRVDGPVARLRLAERRPVFRTDVLLLERCDLRRELQ